MRAVAFAVMFGTFMRALDEARDPTDILFFGVSSIACFLGFLVCIIEGL